jgi:hypothetical protein
MTKRIAAAALALLCGCSPRQDGPTPDEYAVWSAAVDAAFGSAATDELGVYPQSYGEHNPYVSDSSVVAHLMRKGVPAGLARSYVTRSAQPVRVDAGRFSTRRVNLLAWLPSWPLAQAMVLRSGAIDGVLVVSRPGFDESGGHAIVWVGSICGDHCGDSALLMMDRGADGRWWRARTVTRHLRDDP